MDYEKKYKETLERAKQLLGTSAAFDRITIERIFPELKESEDEEMIKWIIDDIRYNMDNEPLNNSEYKKKAEKAIAWLEKQGKQKTIWHNEDEEPPKDSLILLIMPSGTAIVAKIIEPNHTFSHGERWAYIEDLLEKQSEQNPYSGVSFKYNGHTFGMCARDGGVEILIDGNPKAFFSLDKSFIYPIWSKEDERICQCLIRDQEKALDDVRNDKYGHSEIVSDLKEMYRERIDWLKSLKE